MRGLGRARPSSGQGLATLDALPIAAYLAVTVLTTAMSVVGGRTQVVVAPLASVVIFAFGTFMREPDVVFLAWLDQGTNLVLLEAESQLSSILVVTVSVTAVLLLAELSHSVASSGPFGRAQSLNLFKEQYPRLLLVGGLSCLLSLAGLSLAPVVSLSSDPLIVVSVLGVLALVAAAVLGSTET